MFCPACPPAVALCRNMPKEKRKFVVAKLQKAWKDKVARKEDASAKQPWAEDLKRLESSFAKGGASAGKGGKKRKR